MTTSVTVGRPPPSALASACSQTCPSQSDGFVDALGLAPFQPEPAFGEALMEFLGGPTEQTHDRLWSRCAFDLESMRVRMGKRWEDVKAYNLDCARDQALHGTQQRLVELFGFPAIPSKDLERVAVPTILIWDRHDLATPLKVAQAASALYGWPLHVIENVGDDPPMEQPEAFLRTLA